MAGAQALACRPSNGVTGEDGSTVRFTLEIDEFSRQAAQTAIELYSGMLTEECWSGNTQPAPIQLQLFSPGPFLSPLVTLGHPKP